MSQIIPFESAKLPAHIASMFTARGTSALAAGVGTSFPHLSIKGKVFHLVRGDERTLITKPGEDDEPASSIEAIILDANPILSKVFYAKGYEEGTAEKPTCYSNNGVSPEADAQEPQAKKCAVCPHAQWGSKITEAGKQGKACQDSRRVAISTPGTPEEPILLRVPAASLKPLAEYGTMLARRGVDFSAVVTKIGFDYTVAHPALTFKPVGFIDADMAGKVAEAKNGDLVKAVIGAGSAPAGIEDADPDTGEIPSYSAAKEAEKAVDKAPATSAPALAPADKPKATRTASRSVTKPVAETSKVADEAAAPAPAPAIDAGAAKDIASMLADINFDD
jgi:hypothetical protein